MSTEKQREYNTISITNERVAELAKQAQESIAIKANDACDTRWWKPELYDQEFARLIIQEVTKFTSPKADVIQGKED